MVAFRLPMVIVPVLSGKTLETALGIRSEKIQGDELKGILQNIDDTLRKVEKDNNLPESADI